MLFVQNDTDDGSPRLVVSTPLLAGAAGSVAHDDDGPAEWAFGPNESDCSDWQDLLHDAQEARDFAEGSEKDESSDGESEAAAVAADADDAAVAAASVEECTFRAEIGEASGFVSCSLSPWCDWGALGALSDFPKSDPPERRSMVMRCHVHGNGKQCFLIKSRAKGFTTEFMLRWLFSALRAGPRTPATDAVAVANVAKAHKALVPDRGE